MLRRADLVKSRQTTKSQGRHAPFWFLTEPRSVGSKVRSDNRDVCSLPGGSHDFRPDSSRTTADLFAPARIPTTPALRLSGRPAIRREDLQQTVSTCEAPPVQTPGARSSCPAWGLGRLKAVLGTSEGKTGPGPL